jgi:hypothetical protein
VYTRHQPDALAALFAQGNRSYGATALERHRMGIRQFGHVRAQNVPMLENIQYQNQMIKMVPPHAATYRRISHRYAMSTSPSM